MGACLLWGKSLDYLKVTERLSDLAAHSVGCGQVDAVAGLALCRQVLGLVESARSRAGPASPSSTATATACKAVLVGPNSVPYSSRSSPSTTHPPCRLRHRQEPRPVAYASDTDRRCRWRR